MQSIVGLLSSWKGQEKRGSQASKTRQPNPQEVIEKNLASLNLERSQSSPVEKEKRWDSCNVPPRGKAGSNGNSSSNGQSKVSSPSDSSPPPKRQSRLKAFL